MKALLFVNVVLAATAWSTAVSAAAPRREGCLEPGAIVAGLKTLRDADWAAITNVRIQAIWPPPVMPIECTETSCSTMARESRIINGEIECEEVFGFDVESRTDAVATEHLDSVTIHYTVRDRPEIVSIAKSFATAIGVPAADVKTIGEAGYRPLRWTGRSSKAGPGVLDLRLMHLRSGWYLFFSIARPPLQR
jgi:hypothetical protein